MSTIDKRTAKVTVVGDGGCGKSSLISRFCDNQFVETYEPTLFENYAVQFEYRPESTIELALFDTAGE
jgi:small GTP-binding protein